MASIAVLPVLIGLAVDYAVQLQARVEEERRAGPEPGGHAAAVDRAARHGAPTVATAAAATAAGFLVLALSPLPMVRGFGILLVAGIGLALTCALTLGVAALTPRTPRSAGAARRRGLPPALARAGAAVAASARGAAELLTQHRPPAHCTRPAPAPPRGCCAPPCAGRGSSWRPPRRSRWSAGGWTRRRRWSPTSRSSCRSASGRCATSSSSSGRPAWAGRSTCSCRAATSRTRTSSPGWRATSATSCGPSATTPGAAADARRSARPSRCPTCSPRARRAAVRSPGCSTRSRPTSRRASSARTAARPRSPSGCGSCRSPTSSASWTACARACTRPRGCAPAWPACPSSWPRRTTRSRRRGGAWRRCSAACSPSPSSSSWPSGTGGARRSRSSRSRWPRGGRRSCCSRCGSRSTRCR